jgi:hypothetical protein
MSKLPGKNIQIYQITGKKFGSYNSIEFTVHKDIPYLQQTTSNKVYLANELPFINLKAGDYLGIDVDRTSFRFSDERGKIEKNSAVVAKVVKNENTVISKQINVYNSEEFGDGWVEET